MFLCNVTERMVISYEKTRLLHIYILHITLLALGYSNVFQPLE